MSLTFNMVGGGGFGAAGLPAIYAEYPAGSVCTCSNGDKTFTAKDSSGFWLFAGLSIGTWTVTATDGTNTASKTVEIISEGQNVSVELAYSIPLFVDGVLNSELINLNPSRLGLSGGKLNFSYSGDNGAWAYFSKKYDLSRFNTIKVTGYVSAWLEDWCSITVGASKDKPATHMNPGGLTNLSAAYVQLPYQKSNTFLIDISALSGEYWIGLAAIATGYISKIIIE